MTTVRVFPNADELAAQSMDFIIQAAHDAIAARGRFSLALTGGSSPQQTYSLLALPQHVGQIDWANTFLFLGDDRFVSPEDERSNFGMASRLLIERVPIPTANVYPMPTETGNPSHAADLYADTLAQFFGIPVGDQTLPQFDLILLGLGDDGHIASLFPGFPTLDVTDRWVVSSPAGTLPPPVDRVTLTFPVLNAARQVLFMVTGAGKAEAVRDILEGHAPRHKRPAAGVQPAGELTWFLDRAAAGRLASTHDV